MSGNEASVTALKTWTWGLGLLASQTSPFSISISRQSPSPSVGSAIYPTVASRSTQSLSFPPCANTANINAGNACNATLVEPQHGLIDREKCSKNNYYPTYQIIKKKIESFSSRFSIFYDLLSEDYSLVHGHPPRNRRQSL